MWLIYKLEKNNPLKGSEIMLRKIILDNWCRKAVTMYLDLKFNYKIPFFFDAYNNIPCIKYWAVFSVSSFI